MKKEVMARNLSLKPFSLKARWKSFQFAFEGVVQFFRTQHNAIVHLLMTLLVLIAAVAFRISRVEMIAVALATGFVWAAEFFNTAVEKLADMVSPGFHPQIKFIKDVAAAAVLVAAITAIAVGMVVFLPKIFL